MENHLNVKRAGDFISVEDLLNEVSKTQLDL